MQFVLGGPEVPEGLLQAHEEGKVVFFCGAGVSFPAGLPSFSGLAKKIYDHIGVLPSGPEGAALDGKLFDTAIGLLEGRLVEGRSTVRRAVLEILRPNLALPQATRTHEALLTLAETRSGQSRLVTTNFDRLFEEAMLRQSRSCSTFSAPLLPIPKDRWDGLVYLHGAFSPEPKESELNRLVLASGDFGLAYLVERWAARFVSELLRNFTVCFVGYSINDPVMRYMMDALAADRLMGENPGQAFAFGSYEGEDHQAASEEWAAKNVTPILYQTTEGHTLLHDTLHEWASMYRDGVSGKEAVVARYANVEPIGSTKQDDFVRRMIWALSDSSGLPAKYFAEFEPLPPISWLLPLTEDRFGHGDLGRYGIIPVDSDSKVSFAVLHRPSPYTLAARMSLVLRGPLSSGSLDQVMFQLARWLARHVPSPKLLIWIANQGGSLHHRFHLLLANELRNRPLPAGSQLATLWELVMAGRVRSVRSPVNLYDWQERVTKEGLTLGLRFSLREALTPYIELSEPFNFREGGEEEGEEQEVSDEADASIDPLPRWEVVLAADHVHSALRDIRRTPEWGAINQKLLPDVTGLLRDVMDLKRDLDGATDTHDYSYIHQPSISPHEQNREFNDWTILIELVRDGWLALADGQPVQALAEVKRWLGEKYPVFRRLAFFAATERSEIVPPEEALQWLLDDAGWWLWSIETQRETLLLVEALGRSLKPSHAQTLQEAILKGPPREMFRANIEREEFQRAVDRETFALLCKISSSGCSLTPSASDRLAEITRLHPKWKPSEDERQDFPFWMGDGDTWRKFVSSPASLDDLEKWLADNPADGDAMDDDWTQRCEKDFDLAASALANLAQKGVWPLGRWRQALQPWSRDELASKSWEKLAPIIVGVPDQVLVDLARSLAWWLGAVGKGTCSHTGEFTELVKRIFSAYRDNPYEPDDDELGRALNHPVGLATQALLAYWYQQRLEDGQGLREPFAGLMQVVCGREFIGLHYGRIILARSVITLFRVDALWTSKWLLPFFDWQVNPQHALPIWKAFLHSPRMYWPLLDVLKAPLLELARRMGDLGDTYERQFVNFVSYAAIHGGGSFTEQDFQEIFGRFPPSAFADVADALQQGTDGAGEQRAEFYRNRVAPFVRKYWRKSADAKSEKASANLSRLCISAGDAFPEAVNFLGPYLQALDDPSFVVHVLSGTSICSTYPNEALKFLDIIVSNKAQWIRTELKACLQSIAASVPKLEKDRRLRRLIEVLKKNNIAWP